LAEANFTRTMKAPPGAGKAQQEIIEAGKARLLKIYDEEAQAAFDQVVLEHAAAPHVEDAKDRLVGMGLPVPTPTPEQLAASTALENSRGQYTLSKRVVGFVMHQADTVPAATAGAPPLEDPALTSAATVVRKAISDFQTSMNPATNQAPVQAANAPAQTPAAGDPSSPAPAAAPAALSLQEVPTATAGASTSPAMTDVQQSAPSTTSGGSMGIEIVRPDSASAPVTAPTTPPAFPGTATPANTVATPDNGGVAPVGPPNSTAMAPIEKPAAAPDPINDAATGKQQAAAQPPPATGKKKAKVECDKNDESCSTKKPKKGLGKLNPF
jgi:outer membrane protein assembly factor BamD